MKNNLFTTFKSTIFNNFKKSPAKMLIYTGVLGWFLSAAAQVMAIAVNKEIPKDQKLFLIPQEIADGAINVLSFFVITSSIKSLASNLVSTGKLSTAKIRNYLNNNVKGFDAKKNIGDIKVDIAKLLHSDKEMGVHYDRFKAGVDVIGMTIGSILSCNVVTPLIRNSYAADRQQYALKKMNAPITLKSPKGISIEQYKTLAASKYGTLKV